MASKRRWYVACNAYANEFIAAFLVEHGISEAECKYVGQLCDDAKTRDVWEIPSGLVRKLIDAQKKYTNYQLRFFVRYHSQGLLRSADFLLQKRTTKKLRKAKRDLEKSNCPANTNPQGL